MSRLSIFLLLLLLVTGCRSKTSEQNERMPEAGSSYYEDKIEVKYARGFKIDYFHDFKVVSIIKPGSNSTDTLKYILVERGHTRPQGYPGAQVIQIPLRSAVATSSMHIGLFEFLDSENILCGLGDVDYVYSHAVLGLIHTGKITEVGKDQGLNEEKLIEMHPGVVMTVGKPGAKKDRYQILKQAEIPVLANAEWLEKTPLARAEWVKLLAAMLNKEKLVNSRFAKLETEYLRLAELASQSKVKPSLISGLNTKDAWFLPSGDSYMSRFFQDAGAAYYWKNKKAEGSLPMNFESVYPLALKADYWVNVGFGKDDTRRDIVAQDSRYADFKAFKLNRMYSYNNKVNERGSNDFFESGTVNPHIVLSDLIKIFHPELLPDHQLVYYKQLQ